MEGSKGVATPVSWFDVRTRTHGCLDMGFRVLGIGWGI